jgi:hypothetical protein
VLEEVAKWDLNHNVITSFEEFLKSFQTNRQLLCFYFVVSEIITNFANRNLYSTNARRYDMIYQLTYELRTAEMDYSDFFSYLEQGLGGAALHVLRDAWWLSIDESDINILCESIRAHLGEKDVFFISQLPTGQINGWMPQTSWKWYQEHKG